jgi:ribosomal protein S7
MANVSVKVDIKYHITRKDGNKEVGQKIVKQSLYFPVVTETQSDNMRAFIEAVSDITELIP